MNREETAKILAMISGAYPNFKPDDKKATVDAWHYLLEEYKANDVLIALKSFIATNGGGFPPSVSELIAMIHRPEELSAMSEADAWQIVRRAISRGSYHSQEDFEAFPDPIKRAVGSPNQLRTWAMDEDFNEGVESSNFYKRYLKAVDNEQEIKKMPVEVRARLQDIQQQYRIGEIKND